MRTKKLSIGNSFRGYDTCEVFYQAGKWRIIKETMCGLKYLLKQAVANINLRSDYTVTCHNGDCFKVTIKDF